MVRIILGSQTQTRPQSLKERPGVVVRVKGSTPGSGRQVSVAYNEHENEQAKKKIQQR